MTGKEIIARYDDLMDAIEQVEEELNDYEHNPETIDEYIKINESYMMLLCDYRDFLNTNFTAKLKMDVVAESF